MSKASSSQAQYEKMTATPVAPLILRLSVPTIISMLVTNIYNLADTAFVGRINNSASGAVGVVFGFMAVIQAVGFMFGHGSGSIISRLLGKKDKDRASTIFSTGTVCAFILGIVLALTVFLLLDDIVMLLGSTDTIAPYAKTYMIYILAATPFMMTSFVLNNALRYEGRAALAMIGILTGAIINIAGDPILMFGLHMGIAGAGLSTALSQTISFLILLFMFLSGRSSLKLSLNAFTKDVKDIFDIVTTGLPSLLRQGLASLSTVLLNSEAAFYGDEAVAALSIVSRISFLIFSVALGIGQGFQPVSAMNYGAGKYDRVREAFRFTLIAAEILCVAVMIPVMIFSGNLVGKFRDDPTVIEIGTRALRLQIAGVLFLPPCMATEMLFQSTGKRIGASLLSAMRSGIFFIPALFILSHARGLYGIEEAQPAAYVLAAAVSVFFIVWYFRRMPLSSASNE